MSRCNNCANKCEIDRTSVTGVCGVNDAIKVARAGLHFGEEPCISGKNGSGTVFFSGCSLRCVFCQNYTLSHHAYGKYISENEFVDILKRLEQQGAHNINLVTPSHYFTQIEHALNLYKPSIPIVYNSSAYDNLDNIKKDIFDIYLFDLKYFSTEKSLRYSSCENYFSIASENIKEAVKKVGKPIFDNSGMLKRGVIVRHLILPQSTNDAIEIIRWLNRNTPEIIFSLMSQYVPMYKADLFPEINRKITKREYEKVLNECYKTNFSEIYVQELSSATKEFIPSFDLTGV